MLGNTPLEQLKAHEVNELYLFRTNLLEKAEGAKKAIKFITKQKKFIKDETRYLETITRLYLSNN